VGGVKLGLKSSQEVMDAFDLMMYRIPKRVPDAHIWACSSADGEGRGKEVILA